MGRPAIDLTGKKFGRLTVLGRDMTRGQEPNTHKSAYWKCLCDCGNEKSVRSDKLRNGQIQSCGCLSKEVRSELFLIDLSGQRFGKLVALERDLSKPQGKGIFASWKCRCDCGNIKTVRGDHLRNGTTSSCGCLNSAGELKLSRKLQENNIKYVPQYEFSDLKGDYNCLRFDYAILNDDGTLNCLIEFQGEQHYRKWGAESNERFEKRLEYDELKRQYCSRNNIKLIEIPHYDYNKLDWDYLSKLL